ncbi:MAG: hypothetical protein JOZ52_12735 [Acidobacteria bacterium]|nr:hypothetical protein [Acidobacteriota bacterium]
MHSIKFLFLSLCACVALTFSASVARAQQPQPQSLGLAPAFVDANVKRGTTYVQNFTIANQTTTRLRFRCSTADYWYDEQNGRLMGRPGTLPRSASTWMQFTPSEVVIEPNSSAVIKAVISVPQDAAGGYYTVPLFEGEPFVNEPKETESQHTSNASFAVRLGGLLMLAVEATSEYNVEVMGGKVTPPSASSELEMELDIRNRSNAHARLRGIFAILDAGGKMVGRGRIEEKRYLPGQRETLKAPWSGELAPGSYVAVITFTYDRAGLEPATLIYELPFEIKNQ